MTKPRWYNDAEIVSVDHQRRVQLLLVVMPVGVGLAAAAGATLAGASPVGATVVGVFILVVLAGYFAWRGPTLFRNRLQ